MLSKSSHEIYKISAKRAKNEKSFIYAKNSNPLMMKNAENISSRATPKVM